MVEVVEIRHRGGNGQFILHIQYHACSFPGDARSQDISSHDINTFARTILVSESGGLIDVSPEKQSGIQNLIAFSIKPYIISSLQTYYKRFCGIFHPSQWRHNDQYGVSNHQPYDCLLNRLMKRRSKKASKLCVTGLCVGNSPVTGEFPAQKASNAENVSIWWRHHVWFHLTLLTIHHSDAYPGCFGRTMSKSHKYGRSWWLVAI